VVGRGFGVFLEMQVFNFLPAGHDAGSAAETHVAPHLLEVLVVHGADVVCLVREGCELVAAEVVVVVGQCVGEAADYGFGDVWGG
jgi:hypothetical protein